MFFFSSKNPQDQTASYQPRQQQQQQQQTSIGVVSAAAAAATPNSITLLGKLNAPFEIRAVPGRANFNGGGSSPSSCVATSQIAFSVGRDKTEWVAVEAWGPLAEAAAAAGLNRGDRVRAIGKLRCNEYSDRATGQKRRAIKVTLESLARVHDGPVGSSFGGGDSEWADQSQLGAAEWSPSPPPQSAASASGAPAAPPPSSLPSWPAPDAGVDWNAAAVVPESPEEWNAVAANAAAPGAEPAWGGAQQGSDALAWGAAASASAVAPPSPELAPWDSESPESWGGPATVPAVPQQQAFQQQPQQQPYQGGGAGGGAQQLSGEQKWALFFGDPSSYWDNRLSKRAPRAPDFKHKTSGEGLWISSRDTPAWVEGRLGELPPPRPGKF